MRRTRRPMMRFGEREFDLDYIRWGFHDRATQEEEARSVLRIVSPASPLRMLDLGCGIGTHAICWAKEGHTVVAEDISETFVQRARESATQAQVGVSFHVCPSEELEYENEFDVVTCIEFFPHEPRLLKRISGFIRHDGCLVFDLRNPRNPVSMQKAADWSRWEEKDGTFYLERHETDLAGDRHRDTWITIDPAAELIDERFIEAKASESKLSLFEQAGKLLDYGFSRIEFRTLQGRPYEGGAEPYWLWCVAWK